MELKDKRGSYNILLVINYQPLVLIFNSDYDENHKLEQLKPASNPWKKIGHSISYKLS